MNKYDLAVIIPARNEQFLTITVEGILKNIRGKTQVIVGLDGNWPSTPITDHPDLTLIYYNTSIGQRAMSNQCARVADAKWIMKIDAHCIVDEGFDVKILEGIQEDWTIVPILYNLHAFNRLCPNCGHMLYQGPEPINCEKCGTTMIREMIWKPRFGEASKKQEFYQFDTTLHFKYHGARKNDPDAQGELAETMSLQGSCFMLTAKKYWELNVCDVNAAGKSGWGQQGVEVALKTWLSGGKVMLSRKTWYSHLFRTQGGSFGFPYHLSSEDVEKARNFSRDLWFNNKFEKQIYPLSWLIDKFAPLQDWHDESGKEVLERVSKAGEEFYKTHMQSFEITERHAKDIEAGTIRNDIKRHDKLTKGALYYTTSDLPEGIEKACQKQLIRGIKQKHIVSVSLKPVDFGKQNIVLPLQKGWLTMFKQILAGLEALDTDIVYLVDHDVLYHPSHFAFVPPDKEHFYYNHNAWRIRPSDGFALQYEFASGCVADRQLLINHYRKRIAYIEDLIARGEEVHYQKMGFEAGNKKSQMIDPHTSKFFRSEFPNIDIRWGGNNTGSRWTKEEFRDKRTLEGWKESDVDHIEGWPDLRERMEEFK